VAQNALEVARFGGLETGEESSPYEVVAERPVYRLRRYFPEVATGPAIVLVPPLMLSSEVYDVTPTASAVNILSEPYSMRRSVYGYIDRRNLPEMMNHFDFANPAMSTGKRHETTVPQQALFMMNSPLMVDVSRKLLARPEMALAKNDSQRVHALYWMIFQRPPKQAEIDLGLEYLKSLTDDTDGANGEAANLASADAEKPADPAAETAGNANAAQKSKPARAQLIAQRKAAAMAAAANKRGRGGFNLVNPGERVDRKALTPWEKYTHALLMANEMVYYN
jgi:hypothetical protein